MRNVAEAGATNVEFLRGHIEDIPLPAASVDVVISNCVINLAADKPAVFREIARVLRPGGRMGITDVVADDRLTREERVERGSFVGCIAGALSVSEFHAGLEAVGLTDISITPTHPVAGCFGAGPQSGRLLARSHARLRTGRRRRPSAGHRVVYRARGELRRLCHGHVGPRAVPASHRSVGLAALPGRRRPTTVSGGVRGSVMGHASAPAWWPPDRRGRGDGGTGRGACEHPIERPPLFSGGRRSDRRQRARRSHSRRVERDGRRPIGCSRFR
jgi:hypothetical protein